MLNFKLSGNTFAPHAGKLYERSNIINVGKAERILSAAAGVSLYTLSLRKKSKLNTLIRFGGLYLLYRGLSGNCLIRASLSREELQQHTTAMNVRISLTVNAPRKFVYDAWRDFEKLPRFLHHIKKIKVNDEIHSQWILNTPGKMPTIKWEAEIIDQEDGRELSWRSLPGSMIETIGKINFADTLDGTSLTIIISYRPPAGYIGSALANVLNPSLKNLIEDDICKFKTHAEREYRRAKEIS